jgi:hypothetical protein
MLRYSARIDQCRMATPDHSSFHTLTYERHDMGVRNFDVSLFFFPLVQIFGHWSYMLATEFHWTSFRDDICFL